MKFLITLKVLLSFLFVALASAHAGSDVSIMLDFVNNSRYEDVKVFILLEKVASNDSYFCTETGSDFSRVPKKEFEIRDLDADNGFYTKYDNDDVSGFYCDFKIKRAALVILTNTEFKKIEGQLGKLKTVAKGYFPIKFGKNEETGMRLELNCKAQKGSVSCEDKEIYITRDGPTFYAELVID